MKKMIALVTALLLTFSITMIYQTNKETPSPKEISILAGDSWSDGNIELSIISFNQTTLEDFWDKHPETGIDPTEFSMIDTPKNTILYNVSLQLKNTGLDTVSVPLYFFQLGSSIWTNGLSAEFFGFFNQNQSMEVILEPNEDTTVILPYLMYRIQFNDENWGNILEDSYFLVLSTYPNYIRMYTQ